MCWTVNTGCYNLQLNFTRTLHQNIQQCNCVAVVMRSQAVTPRLSESALAFETCVLGLLSKSSAVIPQSTLSISDRSVALSNCLWQCLPIPDLMLLVCELILASVSGFSFVWLHMKQRAGVTEEQSLTWTMEPCSQLCKVVSVSMLTFSQSTSQSIRRVHPLGTMHKNIKTLVVQCFSYISLDQMHWLLHAPSMLVFSLSTIQDVCPSCWPAALTQVRERLFNKSNKSTWTLSDSCIQAVN